MCRSNHHSLQGSANARDSRCWAMFCSCNHQRFFKSMSCSTHAHVLCKWVHSTATILSHKCHLRHAHAPTYKVAWWHACSSPTGLLPQDTAARSPNLQSSVRYQFIRYKPPSMSMQAVAPCAAMDGGSKKPEHTVQFASASCIITGVTPKQCIHILHPQS
jgi:hypothetical protein